MFTGIIETTGKVLDLVQEGTNLRLVVESDISSELKVDQSVAHNGVCLTVEACNENSHELVAVQETLNKTNLNDLKVGQSLNLERCMQMNGRLDGHIVQGHVDETAIVDHITEEDGSWIFRFKLKQASPLMVEKGSICINGVSLTVFDIQDEYFSVTIIPYTFDHTTFKQLQVGDTVNLEFDIIGKYVARMKSFS